MLSLEKIEAQFGSVAKMKELVTGADGEVRLDRPVVGHLIDIVHAGLLEHFDDTPAARREIASGIDPAQMELLVEAFTAAFTAAFGDLGKELVVENRAERRLSHGVNGTTPRPSPSVVAKKRGKK